MGEHEEPERGRRHSFVAGGYVQYSAQDFVRVPPRDYHAHAEFVIKTMRQADARRYWRLLFVLAPCQFELRGSQEFGGSVSLWFWAHSSTYRRALKERELLIESLHNSMFALSAIRDLTHELRETSSGIARDFGAGEGNRTLIYSLGSCRSTTELRPRRLLSSMAHHGCEDAQSPFAGICAQSGSSGQAVQWGAARLQSARPCSRSSIKAETSRSRSR